MINQLLVVSELHLCGTHQLADRPHGRGAAGPSTLYHLGLTRVKVAYSPSPHFTLTHQLECCRQTSLSSLWSEGEGLQIADVDTDSCCALLKPGSAGVGLSMLHATQVWIPWSVHSPALRLAAPVQGGLHPPQHLCPRLWARCEGVLGVCSSVPCSCLLDHMEVLLTSRSAGGPGHRAGLAGCV